MKAALRNLVLCVLSVVLYEPCPWCDGTGTQAWWSQRWSPRWGSYIEFESCPCPDCQGFRVVPYENYWVDPDEETAAP